MDPLTNVQPLPQTHRHRAFLFLVFIFALSLPFLYMYATGYRFDIQRPTNIVSTGGLYVGVSRLGAEIYIDDELVRETRVFRRAFYAQGLNAGTHKVHVQREGYHTWVKELPVSKQLVTEVEAFNLPLLPTVRVISAWEDANGAAVLRAPLTHATSTNAVVATTTTRTAHLIESEEYHARIRSFATTTQPAVATTTITANGVKLYREGDDLFAAWVGSFEQMPYYYCAPDFPRYEGKGAATTTDETLPGRPAVVVPEGDLVIHPLQTVSKDSVCEPIIRMDRKGERVLDFDLFPGSRDLVIMVRESGAYLVEIDDRGWQNTQPLFLKEDLQMSIEGGVIYLFDGEVIYQVVVSLE